MKGLFVLLLFIGIILIIIEIVNTEKRCPQQRIIYRYIPRTFEEEQEEPALVTDIFATMFNQPDTWTRGIADIDARKQEQINKYFISQM